MTVISQGRDRGSNEFSKNGSHFLSYWLQQLLYMPSRFYSVIVSSGFWLSIFFPDDEIHFVMVRERHKWYCTALLQMEGWYITFAFFWHWIIAFLLQHNRDSIFRGYDHNVLPVWEQGVTGKGIVVSILDDGMWILTRISFASTQIYEYLNIEDLKYWFVTDIAKLSCSLLANTVPLILTARASTRKRNFFVLNLIAVRTISMETLS